MIRVRCVCGYRWSGVFGEGGIARMCGERKWARAGDEAGEEAWVCLVPKLSWKRYASAGRGLIEPQSRGDRGVCVVSGVSQRVRHAEERL